MVSDTLLSAISINYLFVLLLVLALSFILLVIAGPSKFLQACKSIFNCLSFVVLELLPVAILVCTAVIVFSCMFLALLGWVGVVFGHDCSDIPYFRARWTKHVYRILELDTNFEGFHAGLIVALELTLFFLSTLIYEHRKNAKDFERAFAKRLAIEQTAAHAQRTTQRRIKQLADANDSLTCLICVDRLTQPYTLAPCGHTFDLECLQTWFRSAHPSPADEDLALTIDRHGALFALHRKKFCPLCHAEVVGWPVAARALLGLGAEPPEGNPWKGLFVGSSPCVLARPDVK